MGMKKTIDFQRRKKRMRDNHATKAYRYLCIVALFSAFSMYNQHKIAMKFSDFTPSHFSDFAPSHFPYTSKKNQKPEGIMVLGSDWSGASMLTGLLTMAGGYNHGAESRKGAQNSGGLFERFDVVTQNKELFKDQDILWSTGLTVFDSEKAIKNIDSGSLPFQNGKEFLKFTNDVKNVPWVQKDAQMCITLKVWLKYLDPKPAIVFTYGHPFEVAMSIHQRELRKKKHNPRKKDLNVLSVTWCLKLWVAYNMLAIQNSRGLCTVRTSNRAISEDPLKELQRITDDLTNKCDVAAPPHPVKQEEISRFLDAGLQNQNFQTDEDFEILESFNGGSCNAYLFESPFEEGTIEFEKERDAYLTAMKVYCDLESGKAYEEDYEWPELRYSILYEY